MENIVYKENIINEMARIMHEACRRVDENGKPVGFKCMTCEWFDKNTSECKSFFKKEAIALYDEGCRFVGKNQKIINIDEVEYLRYRFQEIADQARKETAREIIEMLIPTCDTCDEDWHTGCLCLRQTISEQIVQRYGLKEE